MTASKVWSPGGGIGLAEAAVADTSGMLKLDSRVSGLAVLSAAPHGCLN